HSLPLLRVDKRLCGAPQVTSVLTQFIFLLDQRIRLVDWSYV
ncbi:12776_t:CDS:1, partial [Dentiscutata heterogama]